MPDISVLTNRLRGVQMSNRSQGLAFCPSHEDVQKQSLSIGVGDNGVLLVNCFVGCDTSDVLRTIGLTFRDLFPEK